MTTQELYEYEQRLVATGLSFARSIGSTNLERLEDVPWGVAIVQVMRLTGWRITDTVGVDRGDNVLPLRLEP